MHALGEPSPDESPTLLPRPNSADGARLATVAECLSFDPGSNSIATPQITSGVAQAFGLISKYPFAGNMVCGALNDRSGCRRAPVCALAKAFGRRGLQLLRFGGL